MASKFSKMSMKSFSDLCTPASLYLAISTIALIASSMYSIVNVSGIIVKVLFILIWTYILNVLCKEGYPIVAWLMVMFPFMLIFFILVVATNLIKLQFVEKLKFQI